MAKAALNTVELDVNIENPDKVVEIKAAPTEIDDDLAKALELAGAKEAILQVLIVEKLEDDADSVESLFLALTADIRNRIFEKFGDGKNSLSLSSQVLTIEARTFLNSRITAYLENPDPTPLTTMMEKIFNQIQKVFVTES